jgi:hypothetical protein
MEEAMSNLGRPDTTSTPPLAVRLALRNGNEALAARFAKLWGERDAGKLTSMIFFHRHPERRGARLRSGEQGFERLRHEWQTIHDTVVLPVLAGSPALPGGAAGPSALPTGPLGTLAFDRPGKQTFRYTFTPDDLLWTARFIKGEAGGRDDPGNHAVIWAMLNRYAYFTHSRYPSFSAFLRAYSTPLQRVLNSKAAAARHAHKPEFIKTGGEYPLEVPPHGQRIPRGLLRQHHELQRAPWQQLPSSARALALRALSGGQPNPGIGNASEFAETATYYRQKNGVWPSEAQWRTYSQALASSKGWTWIGDLPGLVQFRKNTFFLDNRARTLPAVRVLAPGHTP